LGVGELDLLLFLFKYPGKYFTTPEIYWKLNKKVAEEKDKASIRKSVQRARQVIEPFYHSKECIYLLNKKGSGYMLNPNPGSRGSLSLKELSCNYPGKDEALF
jgi:DNA-binding response OmpR family regulator